MKRSWLLQNAVSNAETASSSCLVRVKGPLDGLSYAFGVVKPERAEFSNSRQ